MRTYGMKLTTVRRFKRSFSSLQLFFWNTFFFFLCKVFRFNSNRNESHQLSGNFKESW